MTNSAALTASLAIPGPGTLPGLGWRTNFLPLLRNPIEYMQHLERTYGDVVALSKDHPAFLFIFGADEHRQVLSDPAHFYNGDVRSADIGVRLPPDSAALRLFSGLTTMNGAQHVAERRLLLPAFSRGHVAALRETMLARIDTHLNRWQPGHVRDIHQEMQKLTLGIAVATILGLDPTRDGLPIRNLMARWLRSALAPAVLLLPLNLPGLPFYRFLRLAEQVEREIRGLLARKRAAGATGDDALSLLIQARDEDGRGLDDNSLLGQVVTLFVAGHETTATALSWTLFLLAEHPAVQRDLLAEIDRVLGVAPPTMEQLARMPLLDAVIKESLRLVPPGLWFLRLPTEDTHLGPYPVPAGTRILWSPVALHRRADLYPDPSAFRPERWQHIDPSPYEYMPFGAGPRRCLGATFAEMEMKLVLPRLLQRYRLALRPGTRVALGGSPLAAPQGGLPMMIRRAGPVPPAVPVRGNINRLIRLPSP
jgi:cytochrome P450